MPLRLTGQQLAVMRILWDRGEMTVAEVQKALDQAHPLAYSTVSTVLSRLEKRGLLKHRQEGRTYFFRPAVSEIGVVDEVVDKVYGGDPVELVSHFLENHTLTASDVANLRALIDQYDKSCHGSSREDSP